MAEIKWTKEASEWMEKIHAFIAKDKPVAAENLVAGIYEKAQILKKFPETGHLLKGFSIAIRILNYGHYRITYTIKNNGNADLVEIIGIFHGALDIKKHLTLK